MKNGQKLKLGDAHVTPRNIQEDKRQSLGMPWASPSSSTKYQVIFLDAIFLLLHMLCVVLGTSLFLFLVFFGFVCCNQLGWILAFLCGRETRSAFSCEYSYSLLTFVEYSCLATAMLLAPIFHASLVQSLLVFFR